MVHRTSQPTFLLPSCGCGGEGCKREKESETRKEGEVGRAVILIVLLVSVANPINVCLGDLNLVIFLSCI